MYLRPRQIFEKFLVEEKRTRLDEIGKAFCRVNVDVNLIVSRRKGLHHVPYEPRFSVATRRNQRDIASIP